MKFRSIFFFAAFLMATVSTLAFKTKSLGGGWYSINPDVPCHFGYTDQWPCSSSYTGPICTITSGGTAYPAFLNHANSGNACVTPIYQFN